MPMILKNTASRYGFISQFFHWLMALLIVMQFIWAWRIDQLGLGRERYELVNQHKSIGLTLLGLLCLRLAWRWLSPPPPLARPYVLQATAGCTLGAWTDLSVVSDASRGGLGDVLGSRICRELV